MIDKLLFVTGLSGAGKTTAMRALEDQHFWCIDNLPLALLPKLLQLAQVSGGEISRLAVVCDVRDEDGIQAFPRLLSDLRRQPGDFSVLFLEADADTLLRRYHRSQRPHPAALPGDDVVAAIQREQTLMAPLRALASQIVDSSDISVHQLRDRVRAVLRQDSPRQLGLGLLTFAFAGGLPAQVDLVVDTRALRAHTPQTTPHETQKKSEREAEASLLTAIEELLLFLLPRFEREGKIYLTLGIGCEDGQGRSNRIARALLHALQARGVDVHLGHRDRPSAPEAGWTALGATKRGDGDH